MVYIRDLSRFASIREIPDLIGTTATFFFIITSLRTSVKPQCFENLNTRTFVHQ